MFQCLREKRCFLILQGSVLTHARWSETFSYAERCYSFLVNLMQKLSKLVNICKSCCKKFTATLFMPHSVFTMKATKRTPIGIFLQIVSCLKWQLSAYNKLQVETCYIQLQLTTRYDTVYLTCSKKPTCSQLSPSHGTNRKIKEQRTKNKSRSMISPVRSRDREDI